MIYKTSRTSTRTLSNGLLSFLHASFSTHPDVWSLQKQRYKQYMQPKNRKNYLKEKKNPIYTYYTSTK